MEDVIAKCCVCGLTVTVQDYEECVYVLEEWDVDQDGQYCPKCK